VGRVPLILDDIISTIEGDAPVHEVCTGPRASLVRSRAVGLAYRHTAAASPPPGPLDGATLRALLPLARSSHPVEASVGVAAINAAIRPDPADLVEGNGYELIAEQGAGRDVTLVGHFSFVDKLRACARNLWVLELHPEEGDLPASEAPRVIPRSDVVAISGSALVNHTLDDLLRLARGRHVILLGPSTVFSPVLFDHGISAICGAVVRDVEEVKRCVTGGVDLRECPGIVKVVWCPRR
jgi:hypothetical protein